jgi:hypothetical protein
LVHCVSPFVFVTGEACPFAAHIHPAPGLFPHR